jgi:hypothetical protein
MMVRQIPYIILPMNSEFVGSPCRYVHLDIEEQNFPRLFSAAGPDGSPKEPVPDDDEFQDELVPGDDYEDDPDPGPGDPDDGDFELEKVDRLPGDASFLNEIASPRDPGLS